MKLTREIILRSVEPNSDQLNAIDLLTGPRTVTVVEFLEGPDPIKQPWDVALTEFDRPWRPCKTCRRIIVALWKNEGAEEGEDINPDEWVGRKMTLYCDPDVVYGGKQTGGIRISHMSHLKKAETRMLTVSRGKQASVTIQPLAEAAPTLSPEDAEYIKEGLAQIADCQGLEELKAMGFVLKEESKVRQDALRGAYSKRKEELESNKEQ